MQEMIDRAQLPNSTHFYNINIPDITCPTFFESGAWYLGTQDAISKFFQKGDKPWLMEAKEGFSGAEKLGIYGSVWIGPIEVLNILEVPEVVSFSHTYRNLIGKIWYLDAERLRIRFLYVRDYKKDLFRCVHLEFKGLMCDEEGYSHRERVDPKMCKGYTGVIVQDERGNICNRLWYRDKWFANESDMIRDQKKTGRARLYGFF